MSAYLESLFGLQGEGAVVTGATGLLGGAMARGLALAGARVAILGRREDRALEAVAAIEGAGGEAMAVLADVLDRPALESARDQILARWGTITILVNAAGGQISGALARNGKEFF